MNERHHTFALKGENDVLHSETSNLVRARTAYDDVHKTLDIEIRLDSASLKLRVCAGLRPRIKTYSGLNKPSDINEFEVEIRVSQETFEAWKSVAYSEYEEYEEYGTFDLTRLIETGLEETEEEFDEGK